MVTYFFPIFTGLNARMIPITIIHVSGATSWRGGEQQALYLAGELERAGIPQELACPEGSPLATRFALLTGRSPVTFRGRSSMNLFAAAKLARLARRTPGAILHVHDAHAHTTAFLSSTLFGNKAPVIVSRKVDFPVRPGFLSTAKYNHPSIARIICVSEKIREIISPRIKDPLRLTVIRDGIDLDRFAPRGHQRSLHAEFSLPGDSILVGNVAAIAPHKDYFTFVDTVALLAPADPRLRFFIIGDGPLRREISAYVQEKNLGKVIIMTGFREDIPEILAELDVFLITSKTEGLGSTILDAYACRVPVVATAAGGIPEIVTDEVTGLLAPVGDSRKLADQVLRLVNDNSLSQHLVESASARVLGYTKQEMARKTMAVYREVLPG
jgi:L-malate glycosyltransferase